MRFLQRLETTGGRSPTSFVPSQVAGHFAGQNLSFWPRIGLNFSLFTAGKCLPGHGVAWTWPSARWKVSSWPFSDRIAPRWKLLAVLAGRNVPAGYGGPDQVCWPDRTSLLALPPSKLGPLVAGTCLLATWWLRGGPARHLQVKRGKPRKRRGEEASPHLWLVECRPLASLWLSPAEHSSPLPTAATTSRRCPFEGGRGT